MVLNEEQQLLKDTIASFLDENAPTQALRDLRDNPGTPAFQPALWRELSELGLPALLLSEEQGGLGFGWIGLGAVLEEIGRRLSPLPVLSSVAFGSAIIRHCASDEQQALWLPDLATGRRVVAVGFQEGNHFHRQPEATRLQGQTVTGRKCLVMDASGASDILISVASDNGLMLGLFDANTDGLTLYEESLMDGRKYAHVTLVDATPQAWLMGSNLADGFERAIDEATIAISCEMLGGARELLERTVAYLCEREQFGVKIGTFQALQHRCAQAYCDLELAASTLFAALQALDASESDIREHASRCKAMVGDVYQHISNEAVQLHGGMGVTDELDIGLFLKRSRVCNQLFGTSGYHRDRFARLRDF